MMPFGGNSVSNAGMIMFMVAIFLGLALVFTVTNQMEVKVRAAVNASGIVMNNSTMPWTTHATYTNLKSFLVINFTFLVYFVVLLIFYSSFVNPTSVRSYVTMSLAAILATVIISFLASQIWNQMSASKFIDFTDFTVNDFWFINNLTTIFLVNLVAGLLSFVFVQRPPRQTGM